MINHCQLKPHIGKNPIWWIPWLLHSLYEDAHTRWVEFGGCVCVSPNSLWAPRGCTRIAKVMPLENPLEGDTRLPAAFVSFQKLDRQNSSVSAPSALRDGNSI